MFKFKNKVVKTIPKNKKIKIDESHQSRSLDFNVL